MKIEISPDYQYMAKELFDIPRMFDEEQGEIVYSGRNFVRRFIIQGTPVVAKRFKRVNFFQTDCIYILSQYQSRKSLSLCRNLQKTRDRNSS